MGMYKERLFMSILMMRQLPQVGEDLVMHDHVEVFSERLLKMSAGDASMLYAAFEDPSRQMTTMDGTANDLLWTDMAALGWLTPSTLDIPLPSRATISLKVFTITPTGKEPISKLLARDLERRHDHRG